MNALQYTFISGVMQPHSCRGAVGRHRVVNCKVGRTCLQDCTVLFFVHESITQWKMTFLSQFNQMRCKNANIIIKKKAQEVLLWVICVSVSSHWRVEELRSISNLYQIKSWHHATATALWVTSHQSSKDWPTSLLKKGKNIYLIYVMFLWSFLLSFYLVIINNMHVRYL